MTKFTQQLTDTEVPNIRARGLDPGYCLDERYEIIEKIGEGGMGNVFKARHLVLNRLVAIKILRYAGANDSLSQERFLDEARSLCRLRDKNIVEIFDAGISTDGHYFLAMELLSGETLHHWIRRIPLELKNTEYINTAIDYICDVCSGVERVHQDSIVHCDLKPANIILSKQDSGRIVPKILDFGVSNKTGHSSQEGVGTPGYMAPEQSAGGIVNERADVYSLGAILYETMTDRLPVKEPVSHEFRRATKKEKIKDPREFNPYIPQKLSRLILRTLEENPGDRITSTRTLSQSLASCFLPEVGESQFKDDNQPMNKPRSKRIFLYLSISLAFVVAAGVVTRGISKTLEPEPITVSLPAQKGNPDLGHNGKQRSIAKISTIADSPNEVTQSTTEGPQEVEKQASIQPLNQQDNSDTRQDKRSPRPSDELPKEEKLSSNTDVQDGFRMMELGNLSGAKAHFESVISKNPREAKAWYGLGTIEFERGNTEKAVDLIKKALSLENNPKWRTSLNTIYEMSKAKENEN